MDGVTEAHRLMDQAEALMRRAREILESVDVRPPELRDVEAHGQPEAPLYTDRPED